MFLWIIFFNSFLTFQTVLCSKCSSKTTSLKVIKKLYRPWSSYWWTIHSQILKVGKSAIEVIVRLFLLSTSNGDCPPEFEAPKISIIHDIWYIIFGYMILYIYIHLEYNFYIKLNIQQYIAKHLIQTPRGGGTLRVCSMPLTINMPPQW